MSRGRHLRALRRAHSRNGEVRNLGTRHRSEHAWFTVEFSYAGWVECECGYKPNSQKEMDAHIPPTEEGSDA